MKLHFLGTGTSTGVPQMGCNCALCTSTDPRDKRLRCSALLETNEHRLILIDCGPDFRTQMLRFMQENPWHEGQTLSYFRRSFYRSNTPNTAPDYEYALPGIEAVLLTHEHFDHVGGLDDLRPFSMMQEICIFAEERVAQPIVRNMHYCFGETRYPGAPQLRMRHIGPNETITVAGVQVQPIRVFHGKLPILGFRIGDFAYITDMSSMDETELPKLQGVHTLVVNALRPEPHPTHMSIAQAISFAQQIGAERTFFVHQNHEAYRQAEADRLLPDGIFFAYDGLTIEW